MNAKLLIVEVVIVGAVLSAALTCAQSDRQNQRFAIVIAVDGKGTQPF